MLFILFPIYLFVCCLLPSHEAFAVDSNAAGVGTFVLVTAATAGWFWACAVGRILLSAIAVPTTKL